MNTDVNVQIVGPLIDVVEATKLTVNYVYKTAKLNIVLIFFFFVEGSGLLGWLSYSEGFFL